MAHGCPFGGGGWGIIYIPPIFEVGVACIINPPPPPPHFTVEY